MSALLSLRSAPSGPAFVGEEDGDLVQWNQVERKWFAGPAPFPRFLSLVPGNDAEAAAENTARLQAAASVDGVAAILPAGDFWFSDGDVVATVICRIQNRRGVRFFGQGLGVTRLFVFAGSNATFFSVKDSTAISWEGFSLNGEKTSNPDGYGITSNGCSQLLMHDVDVRGFGDDGVRFTNTSNVKVTSCTFLANGGHGLTGDGLTDFCFTDNVAEQNGLDGIGGIGILTRGTISLNVCSANGFTSPNADNITAYNAGNRRVSFVGNVLDGGGNHGMHVGGSRLTIRGNIVRGPAQYGIYIGNNDGSVSRGNTVGGNDVEAATQSGYWFEKVEDSTISNNGASGCGAHGFFFNACARLSAKGLTSSGNAGTGARLVGCTAVDLDIESHNNGTQGVHCSTTTRSSLKVIATGNTNSALYLPSTTETIISGCRCAGNGSGYAEDTGANANTVVGNDFTGNTSDTPTIVGATTQWRDNRNGGTANIASAAAFPMPTYTDYCVVTGTTTITSITGNNWRGRRITLTFAAALTVTDGSNLVLAGNFVTTADDTLSLIGDGTFWYETSRSVN